MEEGGIFFQLGHTSPDPFKPFCKEIFKEKLGAHVQKLLRTYILSHLSQFNVDETQIPTKTSKECMAIIWH